MVKRRVSQKVKAFMDYYFGQAAMNATEAARLAGYSHPGIISSKLTKIYSDLIDARLEEIRQANTAEAAEIREILSEVARDKGHKDRVRAAEVLARIYGQFNDKLSLNMDRKELTKELEDLVNVIKTNSDKLKDNDLN